MTDHLTPNDHINGFKITRKGNGWFNLWVPGYKTAMAGGSLEHIKAAMKHLGVMV